MPDIVFPAGTTATIKDEPSGSPTALSNLRSIGGNESTIAFGDITALSDSTLKKRPARIDPGTLTLTFLLDDTAAGSNQVATLKTKRDSKQKVTLSVNLPGSWDDSTALISYTGYLSSVGYPEIAMGDEPLTYTVGLQVTA
jgi:hypothetical protein